MWARAARWNSVGFEQPIHPGKYLLSVKFIGRESRQDAKIHILTACRGALQQSREFLPHTLPGSARIAFNGNGARSY
jgi:hypothetical protein